LTSVSSGHTGDRVAVTNEGRPNSSRGGLCCATAFASAMVGQPCNRMGCPAATNQEWLEGTHAVVVPARRLAVSVGAEVTWGHSRVHGRTAQGHAVCGLGDGVTSRCSPFGAPRGGRVRARGPFRYKPVDPRLCYGLSSSLQAYLVSGGWSLVGRNQPTSHDVCLAGEASARAPTQRACEEGKSKCHGLE
jgi:hypothetical protein